MSHVPADQIRRSRRSALRLAVPGGAALYAAVFALGLIWTVQLWLRSPGVPVHDEIAHVLIARWAWRYPALLLDLWGRPVNTLAYLLPALGRLPGARLASIGMACATTLLATGIAARLGLRRLFLVPLLLWFQPWFPELAYTAITEVPFMLCLALACWLWLHQRLGWAALCFGLLPLIRHEGVALLGLWCAFLLLRRSWRSIAAALGPLALYNLLYFAVYRAWPFTIYLQPQPTTIYGSGGWLHFIEPLMRSVGLPIVALALLGCALLGRRGLALAFYALYLAVQMAIYRFGLYASGGYELFLLPLAPGFAIAASIALDWLADRLPEPAARPALYKRALLAAALVWVVALGVRARPRPLDAEGVVLEQAAAWLEQNSIDPARIVAMHVWLYYFADLPVTPTNLSTPHTLDALPPGTVVVWEAHYADRWGLRYAELSDPRQGWRELQRYGDSAVIFQKLAQAQP
jgi:hypothetical protein